jgi:hypothetical protein
MAFSGGMKKQWHFRRIKTTWIGNCEGKSGGKL